MIILPCAEFVSDLPEDIIESEDDFIETGGRSVTWAIADMLKGFGCTVAPPQYAGDHGWNLSFKWRKRLYWFEVTLIDGYILQTSDNSFFSKRLKKNKEIYAEMLTQLARALDEDPRFHNIRWYSKDDLLRGGPGAKSPVSG